METKESIGYMVIGAIGQLAIQVLYPEEMREYESLDIVPSHADILEDFKYPIEIKWSSKKIFRARDVPTPWRLQLMRYMAKHNADVGWLLIMNLFSRQFMAFKLTMTADERMEQIIQMLDFKAMVLEAVRKRDPYLLPVPLTEEQVKECKKCDYRPSRRRKKLNLGEGCVRYVSSADLKKKT